MKIQTFLKSNEGGCDFSKHFEEQFLNNVKLHPEVRDVPIENTWADEIPEPEIIVWNENGEMIYNKKGNQVSAHDLQEFILREKGIR